MDYLTPHMSLIHPPSSPQPIPILQVALHPTTLIQWQSHIIPTRMDSSYTSHQDWKKMMTQELVPPTPPPSPTASSVQTRQVHPRHRVTRKVPDSPPRQTFNVHDNMVFGSKELPFPTFNFLTREELMYSMETQQNKLVITHLSNQH